MNSAHFSPSQPLQRFTQALNLRTGEEQRTLLLFAAYTLMSVGILWLEVSSAALFLSTYGAKSLPWIYLFSAGVGFGLSFVYNWLQRFLPLRQVVVMTAVLMALPLLLFRVGLGVAAWVSITVFAMRLWMEAIYNLNELNIAVTANQLFNIREIKRTFPLISSGNLLADALSGFSIYLLLGLVGLNNTLILTFIVMLASSGILLYLSRAYQHAFPDSLRSGLTTEVTFSARRLRGSVRQYVVLLLGFFMLSQVLLCLIEFQYLDQLTNQALSVDAIAKFLGIFTGLLGLIELFTQLFTSSRLIERSGVFSAVALLPGTIVGFSALCLLVSLPNIIGAKGLFTGLIVLKFVDEWLRYTIVAGTRPLLFQPIPESGRARIQSIVGGIAEPLSMGLTGLGIWAGLAVCHRFQLSEVLQGQIFLLTGLGIAIVWLIVTGLLRSRYLNLLILSAERGSLSFTNTNLRVLKQAIIETLDKPGPEADKSSCIELLTHIDPEGLTEVLAPGLSDLSTGLQRQSLEAMIERCRYDEAQAALNLPFVGYVEALIYPAQQPEILALALRYVWLTQRDQNIAQLTPYLQPEVDAVVRGTAASVILRVGESQQRAQATYVLKQMLTSREERERVMGCRALGKAEYMESLSLYVPQLLQDESLRVRRAILSAIAATRLEKYYPSLLQALSYKSTREAAVNALTRLGNEVLPRLTVLAEDPYLPDGLRHQAWQVMGRIGTLEALERLVSNLATVWGPTRRTIARILLKLYEDSSSHPRRIEEVDIAIDRLGRRGIENLLNQELTFLGQLYSALLDLADVPGAECDWLRRSLRDAETDTFDRLFLLMRFLYSSAAIQAAEFSLKGSTASRARGLEILDNTLDMASKRALLTLLDLRSDREKLESLSDLVNYQPMAPKQRLRYLIDLRYFLSDWSLACCFHVARTQLWSLTPAQVMACLQHPMGFVREAVLSYVEVVSPRTLQSLLPMMSRDPNRLVSAQIQQLSNQLRAAANAEVFPLR